MASLKKHGNWVALAAACAVGLALLGAMSVASAAGEDEFEFVGSKKCKMCHKEAFKSWETTTHAKGFDVLKPGERSDAKEKFGLDSGKDYTTDESCLACHTTGYGKEGGYAVPAADDEKAVKKMEKLEGVGCECCHGAGDEYKKLHGNIKKEKRQYTWDEMAAAGMTKIDVETCAGCHNDKSPTFEAGKELNFDEMTKNEKAIHAHVELELRKQ